MFLIFVHFLRGKVNKNKLKYSNYDFGNKNVAYRAKKLYANNRSYNNTCNLKEIIKKNEIFN